MCTAHTPMHSHVGRIMHGLQFRCRSHFVFALQPLAFWLFFFPIECELAMYLFLFYFKSWDFFFFFRDCHRRIRNSGRSFGVRLQPNNKFHLIVFYECTRTNEWSTVWLRFIVVPVSCLSWHCSSRQRKKYDLIKFIISRVSQLVSICLFCNKTFFSVLSRTLLLFTACNLCVMLCVCLPHAVMLRPLGYTVHSGRYCSKRWPKWMRAVEMGINDCGTLGTGTLNSILPHKKENI